jgi:DNA-binding transcriptional regulator PaaX
MTDLPDFAVIRPAPDLPAGFLPAEWDGRWVNLATMRQGPGLGQAVAVPVGRFETRDDGAVAEVWEVRP